MKTKTAIPHSVHHTALEILLLTGLRKSIPLLPIFYLLRRTTNANKVSKKILTCKNQLAGAMILGDTHEGNRSEQGIQAEIKVMDIQCYGDSRTGFEEL